MTLATRKFFAVLTIAILLVSAHVTPAVAVFKDTQGHWARTAIEALRANEIIGGYPDNTFRPEQPMTRAEFAKMVATAFATSPSSGNASFTDTARHWAEASIHALAAAGYVEGYPDKSFKPDQAITRAETVEVLTRVMAVADIEPFAKSKAATFSDVPATHWAYPSVEMAVQLGVLPAFIQGTFEPDASLTRAEAAWMLYQTMRLSQESGSITFVDPPTNRLTVQTSNDRIRDFRMESDTVVLRDESIGELSDLAVNDNVYIVADRFGIPRLVVADSTSAEADITQQVAAAILEVFTPEELQQMVAGDWSVAAAGARRELHERLIDSGVTEEEAQALMSQDWDTLLGSARERVEQAISEQLSISPVLAEALVTQDWNAAREQAQLEVAQHLLNRLLSTMDVPA